MTRRRRARTRSWLLRNVLIPFGWVALMWTPFAHPPFQPGEESPRYFPEPARHAAYPRGRGIPPGHPERPAGALPPTRTERELWERLGIPL